MLWLFATAMIGLVILALAGDALVKGAVALSLRVGVPALIISLTIVAFGTSAPELMISISAVVEGSGGLAMGNIVGSNTANVLLVVGIPALIVPLKCSPCDTKKSYFFMLLATVVFISFAFAGVFSWPSGILLLALLAYILRETLRDAIRSHKTHDDPKAMITAQSLKPAAADSELKPNWQIVFLLALGLIGLPLGGHTLVESATKIAQHFGISDAVIGLTLVALGTSLPELATAVMAALRQQADVVLGNIIGSNMFNLLAIMGLTSLIGPVPVATDFLRFDLWVMLSASLLLAPLALFRWEVSRLYGLGLTASYLTYVSLVLS